MASSEALGDLAASLTRLSFVPQAVRVIRTRDTRAIPQPSYAMFCAGVALWLAYGTRSVRFRSSRRMRRRSLWRARSSR